jgi:hypothetical protein
MSRPSSPASISSAEWRPVRLEGDRWGERRFSDMFALLKTDGKWQIVNKIFHFHG